MPFARVRALTPRSRSLVAVSGLAVIVVTAGILVSPQTASAYPSWSEVEAAKGSASATKTQVATITADLGTLETAAASRSEAALRADAANSSAQAEYQAASREAYALTAQVAVQEKKASEAHQEAGQLAAHLYRIGGSSMEGQLLTGQNADKTLYKLGALSQLTSQWQTVLDQATVASRSVASLSAQADVASDERDRLVGVAKTTLATAQAAQESADAEVDSATRRQATLYAQLASLNSTSAALEKRYHQGEAAKAAYAAQQRRAAEAAAAREAQQAQAATAAAPVASGASASSGSGGSSSSSGGSASSGGSGSSGGTGSSGSAGSAGGPLGSGVVDDPAGAQAYARAALPSHGWDSSQMSCLVLLWNQESGWRTSALNPSSQAYGIPQALPATKLATAGLDWQTNYRTQINWGLGYIAAAYGSPCGAWSHEVAHNWY